MHPLLMRRNRLAFVFALTGAVATLLQGCAAAVIGAGGVVAAASLEDRRSTGVQYEDQRIESRAANAIGDELRERAHVNVTSFNRSVLLTGETSDEAGRQQAGKIASLLPNVKNVTNEIQVGAVSTAGARGNDTSLTAKIRGRFLNVKEFNPLHVKVVSEAGVVYLMGIVTEKEADAAAEIARTTSGARKVVKVFEYCQITDDPCRPAPPPAPMKPPR